MAEGRLAGAVREQVGLGRILPLGGAADGAWITESAAAPVLRRAAEAVGGVRVRSLRIGLSGEPAGPPEPAAPGEAGTPAERAPRPDAPVPVPAPASALPHGPLRVTAAFDAVADRPLPGSAELVRAALARAADEVLGLAVTAVDLEVSGLLDEGGGGGGASGGSGDRPPRVTPQSKPDRTTTGTGPAHEAAKAARGVTGVARLDPGPSTVLAGSVGPGAPGVRLEDGGDPAGRHVQVRVGVQAGRRVLDVALAVRTAVAAVVSPGAPGPVTVAVLVTAVGE